MVAHGSGPLAGTLVIDLTRVLAGPFCTMLLADLGARVVKVESRQGGDDSRSIGPFVEGRSVYFMSLNRGKESIALDLKDDADRAIFEQLLARADVLIENFRPGAMARLGYGFDDLRPRFPKLVYASASGFGQTGPFASRPAYDIVVQAMGGIMSLTGHEGTPPTRVGTSVGDLAAGLFTTIGIQSALLARETSGQGTHVDVAMLDSQVAILENAIARYEATGTAPGPLGNRHPSITPFEALATNDGFVVIAAGNDALFEALCRVLDRPELASDPRFASNDDRTVNQPALKELLQAALAGQTTDAWLARLTEAGIPCGPVNDVPAVLAHPQVAARNMLVTVDDPVAGPTRMAGNPIKLADFPDPPTRPRAPTLDEHRAQILDWLKTPS